MFPAGKRTNRVRATRLRLKAGGVPRRLRVKPLTFAACAMSMCADDHTLAHLLAEMERVDLLLRAQVTRARQLNTVDERFQGLYISEQELDQLLARPNGVPSWALGSDEHRARVASGLEALKHNTTSTAEASFRAGTSLRLPRLAALYGLDAFETDCLLVCLATELDLRYERIYSYLQDDVTKKKPSVDLVLSLLSPTPHDKLLGRFRFADDAPLLRAGLIELVDDGSQGKAPLLARHLRIDDRIAAYCSAVTVSMPGSDRFQLL